MKLNSTNILLTVVICLLVYILFFNQPKVISTKNLEVEIKTLQNKIDSINTNEIIINIKNLENEIQTFSIDSVILVNNRDSLRSVYNPR